jgi:hypothetical protein
MSHISVSLSPSSLSPRELPKLAPAATGVIPFTSRPRYSAISTAGSLNPSFTPDLLGTASGENPAPGTGVRSAFHGSPKRISTLPQKRRKEILSVPPLKALPWFRSSRPRSVVPKQTGQKEKTLK